MSRDRQPAGPDGWPAALLAALCISCAAPPAQAAPTGDSASEALAADEDYLVGRAALKAQDWAQAVLRLRRAAQRQPDDADLQSDLGFAYRKLRRFEPAFSHYKRALMIDPRHRSAHEYIGEAYLMVEDLAGAERHLAALRDICLLPCEEFDDLSQAVAAFRARRPIGAVMPQR